MSFYSFAGVVLIFSLACSQGIQAQNLSIPCRDDSGAVVGAAASDVCQGILPKCGDLNSSYSKTLKNYLSLKIWGFYNGKNVDLLKSTPDNLMGPDLNGPICSVVGHKLKYTGSTSDFELTKQGIGKKLDCGKAPGFGQSNRGSNRLNIIFDGEKGSLWASYLLGAYPWLIRKNAADVLSELKPDLSNLNDVVKTAGASGTGVASELKKSFAETVTGTQSFYKALSVEIKKDCLDNELLPKCQKGGYKLTDPVARICTLANAQQIINGSGMANILMLEIMARVQAQYDALFASMLSMKGPEWQQFQDSCCVEAAHRREAFSCAASCLLGGANMYTYNDWSVSESNDNGRRNCSYPAHVQFSNGRAVRGGVFFSKPRTDVSVNKGFAGFIEYLIRVKVCGQKNVGDDNDCDKVNIPDVPEGVKSP